MHGVGPADPDISQHSIVQRKELPPLGRALVPDVESVGGIARRPRTQPVHRCILCQSFDIVSVQYIIANSIFRVALL